MRLVEKVLLFPIISEVTKSWIVGDEPGTYSRDLMQILNRGSLVVRGW